MCYCLQNCADAFATRQVQFYVINMLPFHIVTTHVRLQNSKIIKLIISDIFRRSIVSRGVVDLLLKTGDIIVDHNQAFVEFNKKFQETTNGHHVRYFDGVWADIYSSPNYYIEVGRSWLQE